MPVSNLTSKPKTKLLRKLTAPAYAPEAAQQKLRYLKSWMIWYRSTKKPRLNTCRPKPLWIWYAHRSKYWLASNVWRNSRQQLIRWQNPTQPPKTKLNAYKKPCAPHKLKLAKPKPKNVKLPQTKLKPRKALKLLPFSSWKDKYLTSALAVGTLPCLVSHKAYRYALCLPLNEMPVIAG